MKYAALLRGIGPSNPNMRGARLKAAAESAGFKNVQTLLASGNVVFESSSKDQAAIEAKLEKTWSAVLGFNSSTIVRSQAQLEALVKTDPYRGGQHSRGTYFLVTFFKTPPKTLPRDNYYDVLGVNALCNTINNITDPSTPDVMGNLDRGFGKDQITSRTWLTVQRILAKMQNT